MKKLILLFLLTSFGFAAFAQTDTAANRKVKGKHKLQKHKYKRKIKSKRSTTINYTDRLYIDSIALNNKSGKQRTPRYQLATSSQQQASKERQTSLDN